MDSNEKWGLLKKGKGSKAGAEPQGGYGREGRV